MTCNLRIAAVVLTILSLPGCTQTTEPIHAPATQTGVALSRPQIARAREIPHLSTSVEVGERVIVTGSTVRLVISVTNHERVPVTVGQFGNCNTPLYIVYDQRGTQVSESFTCGYSGELFTIGAGETVHQEMDWLAETAYYDNGVKFRPLPPGLYRVHAYLAPGWPLPWDTYLSPPSIVRVVAQEPSLTSARRP